MAELSEVVTLGMPSAAEIEVLEVPQRITDALMLGIIKPCDVSPNVRSHLGEIFPHPSPVVLTLAEKIARHRTLSGIADLIVARSGTIDKV